MKTIITKIILTTLFLVMLLPAKAQENTIKEKDDTIKSSEAVERKGWNLKSNKTARKGWDGTVKGITAIYPPNKSVVSLEEVLTTITFIWSPRTNEQITYKLRVWQLMQGQSPSLAIKATPMLIKSVVAASELTIENLITGPCKPPYMCNFIYEIQGTDESGAVISSSELTTFSVRKGWDGTVKDKE